MAPPIPVTVDSYVTIHVPTMRALCPPMEGELVRRLTFTNPKYRPGSKTEEPYLREYDYLGDYLRISRGAFSQLQRVATLHQRRLVVDASGTRGDRSKMKDLFVVDDKLRDYQIAAAKALLTRSQGIISIPTGGGKTRTVTSAMLATGLPGIVFVHTEDIFQQFVQTFRDRGIEPRCVAGGGSDCSPLSDGDFAVAMIPTVEQNFTKVLGLLRSAGVVVFDEAHHLPARTWRRVINACPARFRWGCTATEDRDDGMQVLLELLIGPILYKVPAMLLVKRGYLSFPRVLPVLSGWKPRIENYYARVRCLACGRQQKKPYADIINETAVCSHETCLAPITLEAQPVIDKLNYTSAQNESCVDEEVLRRARILTDMATAMGKTVLVLIPRVDAVKAFTQSLRERGIPTVGVYGGLGKKKRNDAMNRVRKRDFQVLVATTLADEGLDIRNLDLAITMMSGRASGRTKQRTGRLLRIGGQDPLVIELIHGGKDYGRQWRQRAKTYMATFTDRVLLADQPVEFAQAQRLLASHKRNPKMATFITPKHPGDGYS